MSLFLKNFSTHAEYEEYIASEDKVLPNVSICTTEGDVHYNPYVPIETRLVAKYNVTNTSRPTQIANFNYSNNFSVIEIDGVVQPSVVSAYTFSTTGEHTVKYTLTDITHIGYGQFSQCTNLTSVTIPDSVTSIDMHTFNGCSGLANVTIPDSVINIGTSAFSWCDSLTNIVSNAITAPTILSDTFQGVKTGGTLTVPIGSSGYDIWMRAYSYYLGYYNWTKVEQ